MAAGCDPWRSLRTSQAPPFPKRRRTNEADPRGWSSRKKREHPSSPDLEGASARDASRKTRCRNEPLFHGQERYRSPSSMDAHSQRRHEERMSQSWVATSAIGAHRRNDYRAPPRPRIHVPEEKWHQPWVATSAIDAHHHRNDPVSPRRRKRRRVTDAPAAGEWRLQSSSIGAYGHLDDRVAPRARERRRVANAPGEGWHQPSVAISPIGAYHRNDRRLQSSSIGTNCHWGDRMVPRTREQRRVTDYPAEGKSQPSVAIPDAYARHWGFQEPLRGARKRRRVLDDPDEWRRFWPSVVPSVIGAYHRNDRVRPRGARKRHREADDQESPRPRKWRRVADAALVVERRRPRSVFVSMSTDVLAYALTFLNPVSSTGLPLVARTSRRFRDCAARARCRPRVLPMPQRICTYDGASTTEWMTNAVERGCNSRVVGFRFERTDGSATLQHPLYELLSTQPQEYRWTVGRGTSNFKISKRVFDIETDFPAKVRTDKVQSLRLVVYTQPLSSSTPVDGTESSTGSSPLEFLASYSSLERLHMLTTYPAGSVAAFSQSFVDIAPLRHLRALRELVIDQANLDDALLRAVNARNLPRLRSLCLARMFVVDVRRIPAAVSREEFDSRQTDRVVALIENLPRGVQRLFVMCKRTSEENLRQMQDYTFEADERILGALAALPELKVLDSIGLVSGNLFPRFLEQFPHLEELHTFYLSYLDSVENLAHRRPVSPAHGMETVGLTHPFIQHHYDVYPNLRRIYLGVRSVVTSHQLTVLSCCMPNLQDLRLRLRVPSSASDAAANEPRPPCDVFDTALSSSVPPLRCLKRLHLHGFHWIDSSHATEFARIFPRVIDLRVDMPRFLRRKNDYYSAPYTLDTFGQFEHLRFLTLSFNQKSPELLNGGSIYPRRRLKSASSLHMIRIDQQQSGYLRIAEGLLRECTEVGAKHLVVTGHGHVSIDFRRRRGFTPGELRAAHIFKVMPNDDWHQLDVVIARSNLNNW